MSNTHRAYVECTHEDMECREGEKHVLAGGSEKHCQEVLDKSGLEGYVRPISASDLK